MEQHDDWPFSRKLGRYHRAYRYAFPRIETDELVAFALIKGCLLHILSGSVLLSTQASIRLRTCQVGVNSRMHGGGGGMGMGMY